MKGKLVITLMVLTLIAGLSGCAGSKIYLIDVKYLAEKKLPPTLKVVGVCTFEDARKGRGGDTIGVRHRPGKHVDLLKLEEVNLSEVTTQAVKDYFTDNGFQVTDCKGWNMSPEGLDRLPKDLSLVVGGKIDSFMVEAKSGITTTTDIQYIVKIEALIGQMEDRKVIIRTRKSASKSKEMGFDPGKVKDELNSILTEVIQNLFK